jgi:hypothetical protein
MMKKLVIAALASGALTLPALAQNTFPNPEGYSNRGQCQAALMHARNSLRQNPDTRHPNDADLSNSEFNQRTAQNWQCQRNADSGRYYARFVG